MVQLSGKICFWQAVLPGVRHGGANSYAELSSAGMIHRVFAVGIDEDVYVGQNHAPCSIRASNAVELFKSTPGRTPCPPTSGGALAFDKPVNFDSFIAARQLGFSVRS
jgi:hypothetical protein